MPQRPKEHVRAAILAAAARTFAARGYRHTTLGAIAREADSSVGNLYKYFANKQELFAAALPPPVAGQLGRLLRRRVDALGRERDVDGLAPGHPYRTVSEELLRFASGHRAQALFLLQRAEGTSFASFAEDTVRDLVRLATAYAARAYPGSRLTAARRRTLTRIYRGFLGSMASILAEERSLAALREATALFATYHLAGLRSLLAAGAGEAPRAGRP